MTLPYLKSNYRSIWFFPRQVVTRAVQDLKAVVPAWCDHANYLKLEIWKYAPKPLAQNGIVDVVSLAASLSSHKDERIESAVEELLEAYKS